MFQLLPPIGVCVMEGGSEPRKGGMIQMFSIKTNKMAYRGLVFVMLFGMVAGCARTRPAPKPPGAKELYTVYPPDVLRIDISPDAAMSTAVTVRPDGRISLPIVGDVEVEGLTPAEIDQKLTEAFTPFIRPSVDVTVTVTGFNSKRYYVIGEVARQGDFPLTGEISAWEAVAIAGGYTRRAAPKSARVVRGDPDEPQMYPVDLLRVALKGEIARDVILHESDVVYVPPGVSAKIGYFIDNLLFPISSILGAGRQAAAIYYIGGQ
jgi:polysaccharide export outer membrane protein